MDSSITSWQSSACTFDCEAWRSMHGASWGWLYQGSLALHSSAHMGASSVIQLKRCV